MSSQPGTREVAYRLFAAEYDDADFEFSESDEERAPNYVVTPTGARVNRLFLVGVLTELEQVNEEMLRARIVDPTGAFVVYAGQYQPDELAFLEGVEPPTFLAVTGKARTFQPEDSDRVYTSVRPESISEVDADTRDRWVVDTARRTLERVGVAASAIESGLSGDALREALESADVDAALAQGVALALDHYGTTPAYLDALRDTALGAARTVAGEQDEVERLSVAPDAGAGDASALASLDLSSPGAETAAAPTTPSTDTTTDDPEPEPEPTERAETGEAGGTGEPESASEPEPESTADAESGEAAVGTEPASEPDDEVTEAAEEAEELGDFDGEFDPDEEVLDDEEREEIAEEFGTEFSTGGEVESEPEAAPDVTESDAESEPEPESETEPDATDAEPEPEEADSEPDSEESNEGTDEDLDPSEAVLELMRELDDGDGAAREAVVESAAEEYGIDPDAAEDAIEDAMMSGQAYEPDEGKVKPI